MSDYKKDVWYREGNLLFILEHDGWGKGGKEQLRNRITISVQGHKDTPKQDIDNIVVLMQNAESLLQMLTRWQSKCAGLLEGRSDDNDLLLAETESLIAKAKGEAA